MSRISTSALAGAACALCLGCHASMGASAGANAATNGEANAEADGSASVAAAEPPTNAEIAAKQPSFGDANQENLAGEPVQVSDTGPSAGSNGSVLLGARHDLRLASSAASTPTCTCLAVALGNASDPKFDWLSGPPSTDTEVQLVIALGSAGVPCGPAKGGLGASYWGYRWSGDDVVVLVEAAKLGRPITTGAVIPKPLGSGKVYVQPVSKKVPYGRSLSNSGGRCLIGNPGGMRTRGRGPDEAPAAPASGAPPAGDTQSAPAPDNTPEVVNPE